MHTLFIKSLAAITLFFTLFFWQQTVFAQDTTMRWENRPETYKVSGPFITMRTNSEKYLWGDSHEYGFDFPYSHFYYRDIAGSFTAETTVILTDLRNYHNEGLLVKITQTNWIKLYVGKEDDLFRLNTVYASDNFHTDYSTAPVRVKNDRVSLRMLCKDGVLYLSYSTDGLVYEMVRILNMPTNYRSARVGLMADSPMSVGFDASFENFRVERK